jgi:hypothetical protein
MEQEAKLKEEEDRKMKEAEAAARRDEELRRREEEEAAARNKAEEEKASAPYSRLGQYFAAIAASPSVSSANSSIAEALGMFASPDTPVLIVISNENGLKDYDRPTTIRSYLNYLKDQRKNINRIEHLQFDASGRITEVELRKN